MNSTNKEGRKGGSRDLDKAGILLSRRWPFVDPRRDKASPSATSINWKTLDPLRRASTISVVCTRAIVGDRKPRRRLSLQEDATTELLSAALLSTHPACVGESTYIEGDFFQNWTRIGYEPTIVVLDIVARIMGGEYWFCISAGDRPMELKSRGIKISLGHSSFERMPRVISSVTPRFHDPFASYYFCNRKR